MIETIYNFFFQWLFNGAFPSFLSEQGAEFICITFTIIVMAFVVYIAILPIRWIISKILGV